jgi:hypothetical protein
VASRLDIELYHFPECTAVQGIGVAFSIRPRKVGWEVTRLTFSTPEPYTLPYETWHALPKVEPLSIAVHRAGKHRTRQPAWHVLNNWLKDIGERTAWPRNKFVILGETLESNGAPRAFGEGQSARTRRER